MFALGPGHIRRIFPLTNRIFQFSPYVNLKTLPKCSSSCLSKSGFSVSHNLALLTGPYLTLIVLQLIEGICASRLIMNCLE